MRTFNHRLRVRSSRRGASSLTNLFLIILVGAIVLAAYLFVPPYFNNWKLGNMLRSIATKAAGKESAEQIKLFALAELSKRDYSFKPEEITVVKDGRAVRISADYQTTVTVPLTDIEFQLRFQREITNERP
ncbi:MAG: DUF4845 domain-containing protein [Myxococcales bacterium]|nr:MAG: DUF4845 domain-containing protein [Myxococcales bacterium]